MTGDARYLDAFHVQRRLRVSATKSQGELTRAPLITGPFHQPQSTPIRLQPFPVCHQALRVPRA